MNRKRVLIVDDDLDQHTLCEVFLVRQGFEVLHAYDGEEGVALARSARPDVILMDRRMPRLDGMEAFRRLLADPRTARIPVVALSADVLAWTESRTLEAGFARHLAKPVDLRRILHTIRELLDGTSPVAAA